MTNKKKGESKGHLAQVVRRKNSTQARKCGEKDSEGRVGGSSEDVCLIKKKKKRIKKKKN